MFLDQVKRNPESTAAEYKAGGSWQKMSWRAMAERVRRIADGLVALGLQSGDRVGVLSSTRVEYPLVDLGIVGACGISVAIYHSNTPAEVQYVVEDSGLAVLFAEDETQLAKLRHEKAKMPALRKVILFTGRPGPSDGDWVMTLEELERQGESHRQADPEGFDRRVAALDPEQAACFLYTSGTTGNPKGVVLTHKNWCYEAEAVSRVGIFQNDDSILLFLPLAHSFAKVIEAAWWHLGATMAFAEAVDKVVQNAGEIRPSLLPAVPRVFEKVYNTVVANGTSAPGVKGKLFRWALAHFERYVEARQAGRSYNGVGWSLAQKLVFSKVAKTLREERLGGRIRVFVSGGAPLSKKIAYFFDLLGFKVLEGYGLTETSAATCVNPPHQIKIGTVGPALPGTELKIAGDGEVLIRGPGVMKGYYNRPEATAESLDSDGWFHTGDIGELDADGYLRITDRKKDIIVTAGGKNVAPQNLENALKTEPLISQVMVHGDKRKYLTALITVQEETAKKIAAEAGVSFTSYADLSQKPVIRNAVKEAVQRLNASLPSYESIKDFRILEQDFAQETGELTPTLKVKRKYATQKFKALLDAMYDEKAHD
ncbi:AMP-dependent synthetase/ligase [Vulgatibacter sp.]|uniref:AMP-dependent synthetase/ligase n=1 Tax=Vulgatibacter sp. TaxID=1971226 RepID=UPI003567F2BE